MVEGGPVAAMGVKWHCRGTSCQHHFSPGQVGCVYYMCMLSALSKEHHPEGLPTLCVDMPAPGFFQAGWSPDAKGTFPVQANTLVQCTTEPGLQGSRGGGLSSTADVLGI